MRWSPGHRSANVEDRRGGGGRFIRGAGGMGIGTLVLLLILSLVFKRDFFSLVGAGGVGTPTETASGPPAEPGPLRVVGDESVGDDLGPPATATGDGQSDAQHGDQQRPARILLQPFRLRPARPADRSTDTKFERYGRRGRARH